MSTVPPLGHLLLNANCNAVEPFGSWTTNDLGASPTTILKSK